MPILLADANFNHRIVSGLLRSKPDLDIIRAQALGFEELPDPELLEWADRGQRVIITHDVKTMIGFAFARVRLGRSFTGLIEVRGYIVNASTLLVGQHVLQYSSRAHHE